MAFIEDTPTYRAIRLEEQLAACDQLESLCLEEEKIDGDLESAETELQDREEALREEYQGRIDHARGATVEAEGELTATKRKQEALTVLIASLEENIPRLECGKFVELELLRIKRAADRSAKSIDRKIREFTSYRDEANRKIANLNTQLQEMRTRLQSARADLEKLLKGEIPSGAKITIESARAEAEESQKKRRAVAQGTHRTILAALNGTRAEVERLSNQIAGSEAIGKSVSELESASWYKKWSSTDWWLSKVTDFQGAAVEARELQQQMLSDVEEWTTRLVAAEKEVEDAQQQAPTRIAEAIANARESVANQYERDVIRAEAEIETIKKSISIETGHLRKIERRLQSQKGESEAVRAQAEDSERKAVSAEARDRLDETKHQLNTLAHRVDGLIDRAHAARCVLSDVLEEQTNFIQEHIGEYRVRITELDARASSARRRIEGFARATGLTVGAPFSRCSLKSLRSQLTEERTTLRQQHQGQTDGDGYAYREVSPQTPPVAGNLYIGLQTQRYEEDLRRQIEEIRARHPRTFFRDLPIGEDLLEALREALFPEGILQRYLVSNLSLDESRPKFAIRPLLVGPRLEKVLPPGITIAIVAVLWKDQLNPDNPLLAVERIVELSPSQARSFERELHVRVVSKVENVQNARTRQNNVFSQDFVAAIPPISLITKQRLADWLAYLDWRQRLVVARSAGVRYLERLTTEDGLWRFLIVQDGKREFDRLSSLCRSGSLEVHGLDHSVNAWDFQLEEGRGRTPRGLPLGPFVRIEPVDRSDALAHKIPWEDASYAYAYFRLPDDEKDTGLGSSDSFRGSSGPPPESGFLALSLGGDMALVGRLRRQLQQLQQQSGFAPFLSSYIFDIRSANLPLRSCSIGDGDWIRPELNSDQRLAVEKMINAPDLCLVQGPPGTGKTTMIAEAVEQLIRRGNTVLIASQANLAVDNVFERLSKSPKVRAIRLGSKAGEENPFSQSLALKTYYESIASHCATAIGAWSERDTRILRHVKWLTDSDFVSDELVKLQGNIETLKRRRDVLQEQLISEKIDRAQTQSPQPHHDKGRPNLEAELRSNEVRIDELKERARVQADRLYELLNDQGIQQKSGTPVQAAFSEARAEIFNVLNDLETRGAQCSRTRSDWEQLLRQWVGDLRSQETLENDRAGFFGTYVEACNIVGVTCTENPLTLENSGATRFDVAIVDEVSKATPPELLMPMMRARKSILVGDHRQLPPLFKEGEGSWEEVVASVEENEVDDRAIGQAASYLTPENFDRFRKMVTSSLFKEHFENAADELKAFLWTQYRMHPQIMRVVNQFYENRLVCGLDDPDGLLPDSNPAGHRLHGLKLQGTGRHPYLVPEKHVLWLDSSRDPMGRDHHERADGSGGKCNDLEAALIAKCLMGMELACRQQGYGVDGRQPKDVGVVTFYKRQEKRISQAMTRIEQISGGRFSSIKVDVATADRYQGQERSIVLVSLVRHRPGGNLSTRANTAQFERINVAFSRAKELLVITGAADTFYKYPVQLPKLDQPGTRSVKVYKNIIEEIRGMDGFYEATEILGPKDFEASFDRGPGRQFKRGHRPRGR